jgi:hypothetical protein
MGACPNAIQAFKAQNETDAVKLLRLTQQRGKYTWFCWLASRLMTEQQKVQWAVFCAEQVIDLFEKKRPNDSRPRVAIETAKAWMKDQSLPNTKSFFDAIYDAGQAADAAAKDARQAIFEADAVADGAFAAECDNVVDEAASAGYATEAANAADAVIATYAADAAYAAAIVVYFAHDNSATSYASAAAYSAAKSAPEKIQVLFDEAVKILQSEEAL